jgi:hypothetical protein
METTRSPLELFRRAFVLGCKVWPDYDSRFSRHDFTRPQLFACLALRESLRLSYRKTQAFLADVPHWLAEMEMDRVPDHNTLWRAFGTLFKKRRVKRALDLMAAEAKEELSVGLKAKPLTIDSTCYEPRHRSRHYDRVCRKMALEPGKKYAQKPGKYGAAVNASRSRQLRRMPKLALAVAAASHRILALRVCIGNGSDCPDFEPLLFDAWRRAKVKTAVADAGYDSEANHELARLDMNVRSVIPPKDRAAFKIAAGGLLSPADETPIQSQGRRQDLRPACPERNHQQHDETQPGREPALSAPTTSQARDDAARARSQPHAQPRGTEGSRLSQTVRFI